MYIPFGQRGRRLRPGLADRLEALPFVAGAALLGVYVTLAGAPDGAGLGRELARRLVPDPVPAVELAAAAAAQPGRIDGLVREP